jgi:hypothetical protein
MTADTRKRYEERLREQDDNRKTVLHIKHSQKSREVHDSCHVWMQWLEATFVRLQCCDRLTVVKLSRRIGEVNTTLGVIMVFSARTHNVSI